MGKNLDYEVPIGRGDTVPIYYDYIENVIAERKEESSKQKETPEPTKSIMDYFDGDILNIITCQNVCRHGSLNVDSLMSQVTMDLNRINKNKRSIRDVVIPTNIHGFSKLNYHGKPRVRSFEFEKEFDDSVYSFITSENLELFTRKKIMDKINHIEREIPLPYYTFRYNYKPSDIHILRY